MERQVDEARYLVERYINQIRYGCDDPGCREILCHTGRQSSTPDRPIRRYTLLSARAIAISICSSPQPRAYLCHHSAPQHDIRINPDQPLRDPASFSQLLCNTAAFEQLGSHSLGTDLQQSATQTQLDQLNSDLDLELLKPETVALFRGDAEADAKIVGILYPFISFLLDRVPQGEGLVEFVNTYYVCKGLAVPESVGLPTHGPMQPRLEILDAINHEPSQRLLNRIVKLLNIRTRSRDGSFDVVEKLTTLLSAHSVERLYTFVVWLKFMFWKTWDGQVSLECSSECSKILNILAFIHERGPWSKEWSKDDVFCMNIVASRVDAEDLVLAYLDSSEIPETACLLNYEILFSDEQFVTYFRLINHLKMRAAHAHSIQSRFMFREAGLESMHVEPSAQVRLGEEPYFLFRIRRGAVLQDAFDQLWQRRSFELARPLRLRLGEDDTLEVGHDMGGVQIEFFNLLCREALSEDAQLFTNDATTGFSYFRPGSLQPLYMFEMLGLLFALALYNGITLPVHFPLEFYRALCPDRDPEPLSATTAIENIRDGWPTISRSLQTVLNDGVEDLEFTYTLDANGLTLTILMQAEDENPHEVGAFWRIVDGIPASSNGKYNDAGSQARSLNWPGLRLVPDQSIATSLTPLNREEYIKTYYLWLTYGTVAPQADAFRKGFRGSGLFEHRALQLLGPYRLRDLMEGDDHLCIEDLRAATRYEGFDSRHAYIRSFWHVVSAWPQDKQKQLLKFVTAAERVPMGGASQLRFAIHRPTPNCPDSLPTSSTCFGTLYLPRYPSEETLEQKLSLALAYGCEGFGTG